VATFQLQDSTLPCWTQEQLSAKAGEGEIQKVPGQAFTPLRKDKVPTFSPMPANLHGVVRSVRLPPGKKFIALTFDLCEGQNEVAGYQGEIVDILRALDVRATFFMGGKWMESHLDRAQQLISDPRFETGNHTWSHRNLRLLTGAELNDEIRNGQLAYERVRQSLEDKRCVGLSRGSLAHEFAAKSLRLFRFPFGACDAKSLAAVNEMGMLPIQWTISSDDPDYKTRPDLMTQKVLDNVQPGSIVLFHANGRGWYTDDALPGIIAALKAQGYEFKTVSELLREGEPVVSASCYDRNLGDTDQYDELARHLDEQ
jgi:peptidoglycan/xylan/chitin deacetylase (PgdA/CDA1 family)